MGELLAQPLLGGLSPGLVLILGAVLVPVLPRPVRQVYLLALPLVAFLQLLSLDASVMGTIPLFGLDLHTAGPQLILFSFTHSHDPAVGSCYEFFRPGVIAVDHGHSAFRQSGEQFSFGRGDVFQSLK